MSFLESPLPSVAQGLGQSVLRKEDPRLLRGAGAFTDDLNRPDQAYAVIVRSPHAHARLRAIDTSEASRAPGVVAVLTGADAERDGLKPLPHRPVPANPFEVPLKNRDGSPIFAAPHPVLPTDRVRFVGEAVAMVIATSRDAARDAAELVEIDYEPLPAVARAVDAAAHDAPSLWPEAASNLCVDSMAGDVAATEQAFASAKHVVRLDTWIHRVTGVPMEPRAAIGEFDPSTGRYTLYAGSGSNVRGRTDVAGVLGIDESALRVIARDTGGNFGTRNNTYLEFALVVWAARRVGRPVKWTCERQEALLTDYQGRDLGSVLELALDEQGNFLALRAVNTSNIGAHAVSFVPLAKGAELISSVYRFPAACINARAVLTNSASTTPLRSAGRPEVMYVIERLIDLAAHRCGFDRIALRERNLLPSSALPYRNPIGVLYDSGDYPAAQRRVLELADWTGFAKRREHSQARGRLRGIGLANYIEIASGFPRERAEIVVEGEGRIDVMLGTLSQGQGHETSLAQFIVQWLGVPIEQVRLITGDTDLAPIGGGAHSGRSMRMGAIVMAKACDRIVEKGAQVAAHLLEANVADIEFAQGRFLVKGTDRAIGLFDVARAMARDALPGDVSGDIQRDLPQALRGALSGLADETMAQPSFPYGSHVCEVEIDRDTGEVTIARYTAVDDVGRAVNPLFVHAQTHGGIVQGVGTALWEQCHYDRATGQMLTATFMDYAMPRADMVPTFTTEVSEVPATSHPLGIRGGGEGGNTGALGAVVNAVVDALAPFGVEHIEMPVTAEKVWQAMRGHAGATR